MPGSGLILGASVPAQLAPAPPQLVCQSALCGLPPFAWITVDRLHFVQLCVWLCTYCDLCTSPPVTCIAPSSTATVDCYGRLPQLGTQLLASAYPFFRLYIDFVMVYARSVSLIQASNFNLSSRSWHLGLMGQLTRGLSCPTRPCSFSFPFFSPHSCTFVHSQPPLSPGPPCLAVAHTRSSQDDCIHCLAFGRALLLLQAASKAGKKL